MNGRISRHNSLSWNIFGDNTHGADHSIPTNSHTFTNKGTGTNKHVLLNANLPMVRRR